METGLKLKKNGHHQYDDSQMYYGGWNAPIMYYDGGSRGSHGYSNNNSNNGYSNPSH
jgi:hypothetical protein